MDIASEYIKGLPSCLPVIVPALVSQSALHHCLVANHEAAIRCVLTNESTSRSQSERSLTFRRRIHQRTTLPWGSFPFSVSSMSSDQPRDSNPDYATSSGFLNLLTFYSAHTSSALFHAESTHGFSCFQRFLPPSSRHSFRCALPLRPFVSRRGFRDLCI
jgi:hypothetical protein